jgi:hypothetical protein
MNLMFKYSKCSKAASAGDLEELKKMHETGYSWNTQTTENAATNGHLDCLQYAYENGCPWDKFTPAAAARNGHIDCLRYAHKNGCPCDKWATRNAAENGQLECLRYLNENDCKINKWSPKYAARNGHLECFKYCFEQWNDPQTFWSDPNEIWPTTYELDSLIEKINLDDKVWRRLFDLDLSDYPILQIKVDRKRIEIEEYKQISKDVLQSLIPMDIINYCIHIYF